MQECITVFGVEPQMKVTAVIRLLTKSPLRYPGGKSKALKQILPIIPHFDEFREPFVGGGSVFFALKQISPTKKFAINDLNKDLFLFWKYCKENPEKLVAEIKRIKEETQDGHKLYLFLTDKNRKFTDFDRAVRFFVLNRITFSGLADSGGYSKSAFVNRFTESSIKRLAEAAKIVQDATITNEDYEKVLHSDGEKVFIFLDPPYFSTTKSRLYGTNGHLHESFDHKRFAENMKKCKHKWLITYDDSPEVRKLFSFANVYQWELQYGMNNYKQGSAAKGKELFISNYDIPSLSNKKVA